MIKMTDKLHKLWIFCQKVTPLVYDNSLSYYESLCKVVEYLNYVIDYVTDYEQNDHDYIDSQIQQLKQYVDLKDSSYYNQITSETNDKISNLNQELLHLLSNIQNSLQNQINVLSKNHETDIENLKALFTVEMEKFENEILDMIKKYNVLIFNPTNGKTETISKVINDVYEFLRYNAFTCLEFDSSGITCDEFDNSEITCSEFDINGLTRFHRKFCECVIRNPFNGKITSVEQCFSDMVGIFGSNITCDYFDSLDLTSQGYDEKDITAYEFSFKAGVL